MACKEETKGGIAHQLSTLKDVGTFPCTHHIDQAGRVETTLRDATGSICCIRGSNEERNTLLKSYF